MKILEPLKSLKEPLFAKLYLAQTISFPSPQSLIV